MGRYFKIVDKRVPGKHRISYVEAPVGSQILFCEIDKLVGEKKTWFGVPHSIEVDGWGEMTTPGEMYQDDQFTVECITEADYLDR